MHKFKFSAPDKSRHQSKQVPILDGVGFWPLPAVRGVMLLNRFGMDRL